jgi:hypothetical protein
MDIYILPEVAINTHKFAVLLPYDEFMGGPKMKNWTGSATREKLEARREPVLAANCLSGQFLG